MLYTQQYARLERPGILGFEGAMQDKPQQPLHPLNIMAPPKPVPISPYDNGEYTVGWICALPCEMAASKACLDEHHGQPRWKHFSDQNTYSLGRVGDHNVVIGCLPSGMDGLVSASVVAMHMLASFESIRIGLMVGIGGGAPKIPDIDIRLGDVVVSMPGGTRGEVVQYDYGKKTTDGIKRKGILNNPPQELLTGVAAVRTSHMMKENSLKDFLLAMFQNHPGMKEEFKYQGVGNDRLFKTPYKHVGGSTCAKCDVKGEIKRSTRDNDNPCIFYGVIASGNLVIMGRERNERPA